MNTHIPVVNLNFPTRWGSPYSRNPATLWTRYQSEFFVLALFVLALSVHGLSFHFLSVFSYLLLVLSLFLLLASLSLCCFLKFFSSYHFDSFFLFPFRFLLFLIFSLYFHFILHFFLSFNFSLRLSCLASDWSLLFFSDNNLSCFFTDIRHSNTSFSPMFCRDSFHWQT